MANIQRNFIAGRMNKSLDERLVPNGEYVNAVNVRLGSTEDSEIGAVENSKGNLPLTTLQYVDGTVLSSQARCIGAFEDGANLVIYWFVHDPAFTQGATGKLDLIVSFDVETGELLGAHMVGAEVTELIQGYVLGQKLETTEEDLISTVFPHPTLSEMMHESVLDAYDRAIHI